MDAADNKPDVGIVGAGLMGRWHAHYLRRSGARLVAVHDQDSARAGKLVSDINSAAVVCERFEELLENFKLDGLHICTPLESHYEFTLAALKAGINVVVEKPLAATLAQTEALLDVAGNMQLILCPVHQVGFQQGVKDTLQRLDELGEMLEMRITICSAGGEAAAAKNLNQVVADIIPHPLSIIQTLKPGLEIDTKQWRGKSTREGDLKLIGSADDIDIDIFISMTSRPTRFEMDLFCSRGRVYLNFFHGYAVMEKGRVSRTQKALQPFKYATRELLQAGSNAIRRLASRELAYPGLDAFLDTYYRAVKTGATPPVTPDQVLAVARAREDLAGRFLRGQS